MGVREGKTAFLLRISDWLWKRDTKFSSLSCVYGDSGIQAVLGLVGPKWGVGEGGTEKIVRP